MSELETQIDNRRAKRRAQREAGLDAYPRRFEHDLEPFDVHRQHGEATTEELEAVHLRLRVPGRVRALRSHGKTSFADIHDGRAKLQLMIRRASLDAPSLQALDTLDLGDYVGADGRLMRTRTGELTLLVDHLVPLAKALRPLPEKWHGLADVEQRYRRRYLDLVVNPDSRGVFETRARIIAGLRAALDAEGFLEVETPMMQPLAGGAAARPFVTHHNALDLDLYLRVAPELYLKRLLVGGLHRVYEINRNFRNEGISTQHNPEFTMLELYWAYVDSEHLIDFTEGLLRDLARDALGTTRLAWQGEILELDGPWRRLTVRQALVELAGVPAAEVEDVEGLHRAAARLGVELTADAGYGVTLMELFEAAAEERLVQPTFLTEHPVEVSPLAKESAADSRFADRFELYLGGMEIANAFSELNDPDVQAERFRQQLAAREAGDEEAHRFDADYIRALEHAMPPAAGEGIGVDRLTMLFTDRGSIRDVILFPLLRPSGGGGASGGGQEEE